MSTRTKMTAERLRDLALDVSQRAEQYTAIASQMDEAGIGEIEARGMGTFFVSLERLDGNISSMETVLRQAMRKAEMAKIKRPLGRARKAKIERPTTDDLINADKTAMEDEAELRQIQQRIAARKRKDQAAASTKRTRRKPG